jgi:DNA-binding transcriptional LysR family regulator
MLDEIERFVCVVEAGSFTAAARKLGLPKSTLSRALARLEDATRVQLLRRNTRSIALTDEGQRFFALVAPHVAGLQDALGQLADEEAQPSGLLRLTMPADLADSVLSELLTRFATRYPRIEVEVEVSSRLVNLLDEGYDAAIRAAVRLQDSALVARKLGISELWLYASPTYLARRGTPTTLSDLATHELALHPLVSTYEEIGSLVARTSALTSDGSAKKPRFSSTDFSFLRGTIRGGGGVGALPSFIAQADVADGRLVRVVPEWSRPAGSIWFVYPSAKHAPKKVLLLRDFLAETFTQLPMFSPRDPERAGRGRAERGR